VPLFVLERWADDLTSAALLGTATSSMLLGHSYLIAPGMSMAPLQRLLMGMLSATLLRLVFFAAQVWELWATQSLAGSAAFLWLSVRAGAGLAGPLVLGMLAWQCVRIRSTQSATGILYAAVIMCFIGELTSLALP
jgi:hypothetical protein